MPSNNQNQSDIRGKPPVQINPEQLIPGAYPESNRDNMPTTDNSGFRTGSVSISKLGVGDMPDERNRPHSSQLPTEEHPSGSRVGIGSLPGDNTETGVALLPEERNTATLPAPSEMKRAQMPSSETPSGSRVGIGSMPGYNRESGVATLPEERIDGKPYGHGHTGFESTLGYGPRQHRTTNPTHSQKDEISSTGSPQAQNPIKEGTQPPLHHESDESQTPMAEPFFPGTKDSHIALDQSAMRALASQNPMGTTADKTTSAYQEQSPPVLAGRGEEFQEQNPVPVLKFHDGSIGKIEDVTLRNQRLSAEKEDTIFSATQREGVQASGMSSLVFHRCSNPLTMSSLVPGTLPTDLPTHPSAETTPEQRGYMAREVLRTVGGTMKEVLHGAEEVVEGVGDIVGGAMHGAGHVLENVWGKKRGEEESHQIGKGRAAGAHPTDEAAKNNTSSLPDSASMPSKEGVCTFKPESYPSSQTSHVPPGRRASPSSSGSTKVYGPSSYSLMTTGNAAPSSVPPHGKTAELSRKMREMQVSAPSEALPPAVKEEYFENVLQNWGKETNQPLHRERREKNEYSIYGEKVDSSGWLSDPALSDTSATTGGTTDKGFGRDEISANARGGYVPGDSASVLHKNVMKRVSGHSSLAKEYNAGPGASQGKGTRQPASDSTGRGVYDEGGAGLGAGLPGVSSSTSSLSSLGVLGQSSAPNSGVGIGTGVGGVEFHHEATRGGSILPGYPTPAGMEKLVRGRMREDTIRATEYRHPSPSYTVSSSASPTMNPRVESDEEALIPKLEEVNSGTQHRSAPQDRQTSYHPATVEDEEMDIDEDNREPLTDLLSLGVEKSGEGIVPAHSRIMEERPEIPVFRSGGDTATGKFEAMFVPVTGQPEELEEGSVFEGGRDAARGNFEATMEPAMFPRGPTTSAQSTKAGANRKAPGAVVMKPQATPLGPVDSPADQQSGFLASRSPLEVKKVPVFQGSSDAAAGSYEASFARVTGRPEEIQEIPIFRHGEEAAAGQFEAKMDPKVFPIPSSAREFGNQNAEKKTFSAGTLASQEGRDTKGTLGGLSYLGEPIPPDQKESRLRQARKEAERKLGLN